MAGRQVRRLAKELGDLPAVAVAASEESESEGSDAGEGSAAPFNPFSLLTDGEEEEPEAEEEEKEEEPESSPEPAARRGGGGGGSKQRSRPKQKPKGKGKAAAAEEGAAAAEGKPEEDIDAILQELNITPAVAPAAALAAGAGAAKPLLAVDTRALRADDELRRMFGRDLAASEAEGEDGGAGGLVGASRRMRRLAARGLLRRDKLKPGLLIQPKDHWPRFDGGLAIEPQGLDASGRQVFICVYSQAYLAVQDLYEECQATFDPNAIAGLLQAHPYHLDALLTMHDLYRNMGENSYADEMLERCVYALEMSLHPTFWGAAGSLQVPYEEENMPLFIALFRYMQTLSRRGLHKTALEVGKLLLGLNADDPLGVLCCIDYLALRAGQHAWLARLIAEQGGGLPNMVYSHALSRWFQERAAPSNRGRGGEASTSGGTGEPSSLSLLATAVQMHPLVVVELQAKLKDKGVGNEAAWEELLRHPLFAQGGGRDSASLRHLVAIFVERQHLLWKAPEVQAWLRDACAAATAPDGAGAADWACMREQAFPPSDVNEYRHLRVHDFSDAVHRLPPEEMHGMQQGAGGGAGMQALQEADLAAMQEMMEAAQGDMTNEELQAANPLAMLLRTLLPWVNVGQAPPPGEEGEGGEAAEGDGGEGAAGGRGENGPPPQEQDDRH